MISRIGGRIPRLWVWLKKRRAGGGAWSPLDLAPALWLKADAGLLQTSGGSAALSDGDPVGQWQDQSGNGKHFAVVTGGFRPTLQTAEQNSLPVVRFDGIDDVLSSASITFKQAIVVYRNRLATFGGIYAGLLTGTDAAAQAIVWIGDGIDPRWYNEPTLTTVYHYNGAALAEGEMTPPFEVFGVCSISAAAGWSYSMQIGADRTNGRPLDGDVGELLLFTDVLSDEDRQAVEEYLSAKWGTP